MAHIFEDVIVLDGGFATELQDDGHALDHEGDHLWSARLLLTNPDAVVEVHKRFLEAGAQIIETNSYHATLPLLEDDGLSPERAVEILKSSVTLAKKAVQSFKNNNPNRGKIYIAGSVGPYACIFHDGLCYCGNYVDKTSKKEMIDYHYTHAKALVEMGIDILCFESVPAMKEAECILEALDKIPDICAWVAFTCKNTENISHGEKLSDTIGLVSKHPRVVAVGVNCSDPKYITELLKSADSARNGKPFIVYPNKGEIFYRGKGWEANPCPKRLNTEEYVKEWINCGAKAIGGCCRVYAKEIEKMRKAVDHITGK